MLNYIALTILILIVSILYDRYIQKYNQNTELEAYERIKYYLLNDSSISKKSIIWIHLPYKYNARQWSSFYSRSSHNLNQPYQFLTIKSIIKNNQDCHICLIDDDSFNNLIPNWTLQLDTIAEPSRDYVRLLAQLKLLYHYGGIFVPSSFLCFRSISKLINNEKPFIIENQNHTLRSDEYLPDYKFMGSNKNNKIINNFIHYMEILCSKDYTNTSIIVGNIQDWCLKQINEGTIDLISGSLIGIKTPQNKPILLDNLFEEKPLNIHTNAYGLYIPQNELIKRNQFNWFCSLEPNEIPTITPIIGQYFKIF